MIGLRTCTSDGVMEEQRENVIRWVLLGLIIVLLLLMTVSHAFALDLRTIYNPWTSRLDYYTGNNFSGQNLSADGFYYSNGTQLTGGGGGSGDITDVFGRSPYLYNGTSSGYAVLLFNRSRLLVDTINSSSTLNGSKVLVGTVPLAQIDSAVAVDADITSVESRIDDLNASVIANDSAQLVLINQNAADIDAVNATVVGNCTIAGSCSSIAYMNYLNTGDLNITGNITFSEWVASTKGLSLVESSDNNNLTLNADVGGVNAFTIATNGAFLQLFANPGVANDYLMFSIEETQGSDTQMNFYEGGTGNNRFWSSGSVRIGGSKGSQCSVITSDVDCDTASTGADLVVQDDVYVGGKILTNNWTNFTGTESQITDLVHYTASDAASDLQNSTIVRASARQCSGTDQVDGVVVNRSGVFINCSSQGAGGGITSFVVSNGSTTSTITDGEQINFTDGTGIHITQTTSQFVITSTVVDTNETDRVEDLLVSNTSTNNRITQVNTTANIEALGFNSTDGYLMNCTVTGTTTKLVRCSRLGLTNTSFAFTDQSGAGSFDLNVTNSSSTTSTIDVADGGLIRFLPGRNVSSIKVLDASGSVNVTINAIDTDTDTSDHGALAGLTDDDHVQYLTENRFWANVSEYNATVCQSDGTNCPSTGYTYWRLSNGASASSITNNTLVRFVAGSGITITNGSGNNKTNITITNSLTDFGASIDDTELTAESFGEFTCDGSEDGCTIASAIHDDEYIELADAFINASEAAGSEAKVSGTYAALIVNVTEGQLDCVAITGSASLCDGDDAAGAGSFDLNISNTSAATSTLDIVDGGVIRFLAGRNMSSIKIIDASGSVNVTFNAIDTDTVLSEATVDGYADNNNYVDLDTSPNTDLDSTNDLTSSTSWTKHLGGTGSAPFIRESIVNETQLRATNAGSDGQLLSKSGSNFTWESDKINDLVNATELDGVWSSNGFLERTGVATYSFVSSTGTGNVVRTSSPTIDTPVLTLATTSNTASGRISVETTNDTLMVGNGSVVRRYFPFSTMTTNNICRYDGTNRRVNCNIVPSTYLNTSGFNAANLTSGTVPSARISGTYSSLTGTGTVTTGTWSSTISSSSIGSNTFSSGATLTGNVTLNGNLSVNGPNYVICFNSACSARQWYNGTHLITVVD